MRKIINITAALLFILVLQSCEYDNYEAPSISFTGKLTHDGQNFLYDGSSGRGLLVLHQKGFGKIDNGTGIRIDEEGNFSQLIFPGEYWLTLNNTRYPFELDDFHSLGAGLGYDSIYINVKSNQVLNLEVKPYYTISDFSVAVEGTDIVMRCNVQKNEGTREVAPRVIFGRAYVSTSSKVNGGTTCTKSKRAIITDSGNIEIAIPIKANSLPNYRGSYTNNYRDYAFCRMAIELDGIAQYYLFSDIKKLEGIPQE
jgi:hypothetical protein